ncbi:hypothetical protein RUM43_011496 [Polyplax serrata]|uniref:Uncharacterized protein n=1 Tax=Polyplax serrata TaxID=468196 RepID=A0AAN8NMC8_POLSC
MENDFEKDNRSIQQEEEEHNEPKTKKLLIKEENSEKFKEEQEKKPREVNIEPSNMTDGNIEGNTKEEEEEEIKLML